MRMTAMPGSLVRTLKWFVQLSSVDRSVLLQSIILITSIRITLPLISFRFLQRFVARTPSLSIRRFDSSQIAWGITNGARAIPGATCLIQALAAQALLLRHGYEPKLTIGVRKDRNQLSAHAWVECDQHILVGGPDVDEYRRLTSW
jgi:hypothetical protein